MTTRLKYSVWALIVLLLVAMGAYTHRMWQVVYLSAAIEEELADGNWMLAENLHFFNKKRNMVAIYSYNMPSRYIVFDDMQIVVVPLVLEHGRHPRSGRHFINVNDGLLLKYACYLSTIAGNIDLATAILNLLRDNDSDASERDAHVISACLKYICGDSNYQEIVKSKAKAYAYHRDVYMGGEQFSRFRRRASGRSGSQGTAFKMDNGSAIDDRFE